MPLAIRYVSVGIEARSDIIVDGLRDPRHDNRRVLPPNRFEDNQGPSSTFAGRRLFGRP